MPHQAAHLSAHQFPLSYYYDRRIKIQDKCMHVKRYNAEIKKWGCIDNWNEHSFLKSRRPGNLSCSTHVKTMAIKRLYKHCRFEYLYVPLFKQGFGPLRKVMEYEDQWCLGLFLLELIGKSCWRTIIQPHKLIHNSLYPSLILMLQVNQGIHKWEIRYHTATLWAF